MAVESAAVRFERQQTVAAPVASLARELELCVDEVDRIFQRELERLAAQARLQDFVLTLAVSHTRKLLRERQRNTAASPGSHAAA